MDERAGTRGDPSCGLRQLAVVIHNIEPATFEHCALIRDWLDDLGVDRVTLLVIPAADHHPFFQRSPALAEWLRERRAAGDGDRAAGLRARAAGGQSAGAVRAGRQLMQHAGLAPSRLPRADAAATRSAPGAS